MVHMEFLLSTVPQVSLIVTLSTCGTAPGGVNVVEQSAQAQVVKPPYVSPFTLCYGQAYQVQSCQLLACLAESVGTQTKLTDIKSKYPQFVSDWCGS